MTDRKSLAAGEDMWEAYEQELAPAPTARPVVFSAIEPEGPPERMQMGSIVNCDRCGQPREYFARSCVGCKALDQLMCPCGHTGAVHHYGRGTRTRRRMWTCPGEGIRVCKDFPDPIKQVSRIVDQGKITQITVWDDVKCTKFS